MDIVDNSICLSIDDLRSLYRKLDIDLVDVSFKIYCLKHHDNAVWSTNLDFDVVGNIDFSMAIKVLQRSEYFVLNNANVAVDDLQLPCPVIVENPFFWNSMEELKIKADLMKGIA